MSETAAEHKAEAPKKLSFAIIVCSTSRYEQVKSTGKVDDPSGDLIAKILKQNGHDVVYRTIVSDQEVLIKQSVKEALESSQADVVITCGGTGISPTDVTVETVKTLLDKELSGFGEALRRLSYEQIGSAAIITRALAGTSNGKAVFCIPGSPQAVSLALEKLILLEAGHIIKHARGK